jgi:hypothetical protein
MSFVFSFLFRFRHSPLSLRPSIRAAFPFAQLFRLLAEKRRATPLALLLFHLDSKSSPLYFSHILLLKHFLFVAFSFLSASVFPHFLK